MPILFEREVCGRFRLAVDGDKGDVAAIAGASRDPWFGEVDVGRLIELSTLSICLVDVQQRVAGFVALCDHPNEPAVPPQRWEHWIRNMYERFYLSRNTLFVHYMACVDEEAPNFVDRALHSVFATDAHLQQIVFFVPPKCPTGVIFRYETFKRRMLQKIYPKRDNPSDVTQHLFVAARGDFFPKLCVRRAVEEDNDDIVEILDRHCPLLKEVYGSYYASEIIGQRPPSPRRIIVGEWHEAVVGVMCVTSDVDYRLLQDVYELRAFYGLRKPTALDKEKMKIGNSLLETFGEPIMNGQFGPFERLVKSENKIMEDRTKSRDENTHHHHTSKLGNKVNFGAGAARKSQDQSYFRRGQSDDISDQVFMDNSMSSTPVTWTQPPPVLEADPFDYDIVNIDSTLLAVPSMLSLDFFGNISKQTSRENLSKTKPKCKRRKVRKSTSIAAEPSEMATYYGEPNAFAIELFGMREDCDNMHCLDLLEAAFEAIATADYCVIRAPTSGKSFPLLQHFCFVPTKKNKSSDYAMYVAHRNSVFGKLRVREAETADVPQLCNLLVGLEAREALRAVEAGARRQRTRFRPCLLLSGLTVVGLAILEPPEQVEYIRAKFDLDSYHNHKYHYHASGCLTAFSSLKTALVSPAFEPHFRFFARELLRLSGSTALLWLTAYRNKWVLTKANSIVSAMVPALPRRSEIDCVDIPELRRLSSISKELMAFSAWFVDSKLTSLTKVTVDTRIVIVGASDTALGFLDSLIFSDPVTYLTFTSVTLVSPHGLPYARHARPAAELMLLKRRQTEERYLKSVPYTYYLNLIHASMVEIDRQNQVITLSSGGRVYYDMLFLLIGRQHQQPGYMDGVFEKQADIQQGRQRRYTRLDCPRARDSELHLAKCEAPENVFIVNDIFTANRALNFVSEVAWHDIDNNIIVYGASIHAYCCLSSLLKMKVPAENIVFVEPFPPQPHSRTRIPVFNNSYVDHTVREVIASLNIKVYSGFYFEGWTVTPDNVVSHVDFLSDHILVRLQCSAMFFYGDKGVDALAFNAISKCGMAYDGGIQIDHNFRTKDPRIYAAGPGARYLRRYYAESRQHNYCDSFEVGETLGIMIRNQLDPLYQRSEEPALPKNSKARESSIFDELKSEMPDDSSRLNSTDIPARDKLPALRRPLVTHCKLPGGMQYLEVRPPGKRTPHQYVQSLEFNGTVLETFKNGYFKIHLTRDMVVDGVTCLTQSTHALDNFRNLYGLSARILNNLHLRYGTKQLDNLYEFFREPWAFFLYHDKREELFTIVKNIVPQDSPYETLKEALSFIGNRLSNASYQADTKLKLRSIFEKSAHVEAITSQVIDWLSEQDASLPMYMQPSQAPLFSTDMKGQQCFQRRKRRLERMILM